MNFFDEVAVLITLAAAFGYINHRFLRLPTTTGILSIALLSSLLLLVLDSLFPQLQLGRSLKGFLAGIDFNQALMHGMLGFLLFAGALHLNFEDLKSNKWTILLLATLGVLISTLLVGGLAFLLLKGFRLEASLSFCMVFGALISPTDPIAILGLLKELRASKDLEATIAGESLFNDGVGVVVFFSLTSLAGIGGDGSGLPLQPLGVFLLFFQEAAGGVCLGLGMGYLAIRMLKGVNFHQLELLITLALVMFMYSISFKLGVSGPIAVVVAGLMMGNQGKKLAMTPKSAEHVEAFWGMVDDILNSVLFLLIGLEVFNASLGKEVLWVALGAIPLTLFARYFSVLLPVAILRLKNKSKGLVPILAWGGLRGGLSVAMALSLPPLPEKTMILAATFGVVLFSLLVQGLTMKRLLAHFGVGR